MHGQPHIRLGEQYRSLSSSLCSFLHSPVTSSILGPNIPLNTPFSNTLTLRSSLSVRDQVPHKIHLQAQQILFASHTSLCLPQCNTQPTRVCSANGLIILTVDRHISVLYKQLTAAKLQILHHQIKYSAHNVFPSLHGEI